MTYLGMQKLANLITGKRILKVMARDIDGTGGFEIVFEDGQALELYSVPGEHAIIWCVVPDKEIPKGELDFYEKSHQHL